MKTTQIGSTADKATDLETVSMTIDQNSMSVLMGSLTNLYSNPAEAVIREYTSNGFDSHTRAGQTRPVEVSTPAVTNGFFVVEDFGVGMSKDEIANVYSRYGLSTKSGNNDEIGGFGLGCKSALAIADRFDIVSVKDGMRVEAFIQKNTKGVGVVHFVSEVETTAPTGVKITIPVGQRNVQYFSEANLAQIFLATAKDSILINGKGIKTINDDPWVDLNLAGERIGAFYNAPYSYGSPAWSYKTVSINVGGVIYSIDNFSGVNAKFDSFRRLASRMRIVIDAPIGSVDLVPSRESIMNTDRSNATITALLTDAEQAIKDFFETKLQEVDSFSEAVIYTNKVSSLGFWENEMTYRGTLIPTVIDVKSPTSRLMHLTRKMTSKAKTSNVESNMRVYTGDLFGVRGATPLMVKVDSSNAASPQVDELRKNLAYYSLAVSNGEVNAFVFDQSCIDSAPILEEAFKNSGVSYETIMETAATYKSESRKALLAANKAARANGQAVSSKAKMVLPAYTVSPDGDALVKPVEVSTLSTLKVAYIHQTHSTYKLRRIFPTLGYYYENGGAKLYEAGNSKTLPLIRKALEGYTLVFLKHNRLVDKFLMLLPNAVDAETVIDSYISGQAKLHRDALIGSIAASGDGDYAASQAFAQVANLGKGLDTAGVLNSIVKDETKTVFKSAMASVEHDENIVREIRSWGFSDASVEQEVESLVASVTDFNNRYPLASHALMVNETALNHLVAYVNMVDSM